MSLVALSSRASLTHIGKSIFNLSIGRISEAPSRPSCSIRKFHRELQQLLVEVQKAHGAPVARREVCADVLVIGRLVDDVFLA